MRATWARKQSPRPESDLSVRNIPDAQQRCLLPMWHRKLYAGTLTRDKHYCRRIAADYARIELPCQWTQVLLTMTSHINLDLGASSVTPSAAPSLHMLDRPAEQPHPSSPSFTVFPDNVAQPLFDSARVHAGPHLDKISATGLCD
jgi:hypothetical protein